MQHLCQRHRALRCSIVVTIQKNTFVKFVSHVKKYRHIERLSQEELADLMGVHRATIIRLETSQCQPSFELAYKLAKRFSIHIDELFTFIDETDRNEKLNARLRAMQPRIHPSRIMKAK